jgi:hypothetical protein
MMMTPRRVAPLASLLASLALTGCAGRSGTAPPPVSPRAAPASASSVIQSTEGGFTVAFPGPVTEERRVQPTEVGDVTLHTFIAARPEEDAAYYVSYTDFPRAAVAQANPRDVVDRASRGALEALGASGITSRQLTLEGGFPGQEVGGLSGPRRLRGRFFMVGPRLYQQLLLHPDGHPPTDADRFFESFTLDPRTTSRLEPRPQ